MSSRTPMTTRNRVASPRSLSPSTNGATISTAPIARSIRKCVRSGISFTSESRQRVDMPEISMSTPTAIDTAVAELTSSKPKIHGAAISRIATTGSSAAWALRGIGPLGMVLLLRFGGSGCYVQCGAKLFGVGDRGAVDQAPLVDVVGAHALQRRRVRVDRDRGPAAGVRHAVDVGGPEVEALAARVRARARCTSQREPLVAQ